MINRQMLQILRQKNNSKFGRIVVVTGARQTGKTTLVRNTFSDFPYISIEDPVTAPTYKNLSATQWHALFPKAILDEIQKEPQMIESIKSVYDQFQDTKYVLLGSSQILLMKKVRESLAGRCILLELFPLTFPEMLTTSWEDEIRPSYFQQLLLGQSPIAMPLLLDSKHPQKMALFAHYLQYGAYPAISGNEVSDMEKKEWLQNYVRTYLERDIRDLADLRHLEPFAKVQKLLALHTAQTTNFSQLAAEAGVSSKTALQFLEYMAMSYQIISLPPWHRNESKRLVKSSKVHFLDPGVQRAIVQKQGELNGHEFESAIVAEMYKQIKTLQIPATCYHLRTLDGKEIDFLIEMEQGYIAIEIKQSQNVRPTDGKHLRNLEDILDKPILHKIVLSNDLNNKELGERIESMNAISFLG